MKKGMTLIEVMVSLLILMIVLGAIYSILNIQQKKALNVQTTSVLQTDAQVALTLLRWDLFMAGYGMSDTSTVLAATNSSIDSDSLGMRSMAFGFEASSANWSPVLEPVLNSDRFMVFRHSDASANLTIGDTLAIVSAKRNLLEEALIVMDTNSTTYMAGEDSIPALEVQLSSAVTIGQGAVCFKYSQSSYHNGISYFINNQNQLLRGSEVFLENVEDIQFKYGIDENDNGVIDSTTGTNEWHDNLAGFEPQDLIAHTTVVRATFVVLGGRFLTDYRYPATQITIEDHNYPLDIRLRMQKRAIVRSITFPRNLRS